MHSFFKKATLGFPCHPMMMAVIKKKKKDLAGEGARDLIHDQQMCKLEQLSQKSGWREMLQKSKGLLDPDVAFWLHMHTKE